MNISQPDANLLLLLSVDNIYCNVNHKASQLQKLFFFIGFL